MSTITVNGLGSGLDYNSWIEELVAVKQAKIDAVSKQVSTITSKESALSSLKTNYSSLLSNIQTLSDTLSSTSVFNKKTATSSSDAITVSADSKASTQSIKVTVESLATVTTAKSTSNVAAFADATTKISGISEGAIKAGTFSVYVGGVKHSLSITSDETMDDVVKALNYDSETGTGIEGVKATFIDGKLNISASGTSTVTVGSSSDTSNFSNVMSLTKQVNGSYESSKAVFSTDTTAVITSTTFASKTINGTPTNKVTEGTFTIGNAEFTIDSTTTLDSLITKINNNKDAGVNAYWDSNSGKLVLNSTEEGATNINIEAGTSNFTDMMGLTASGGIVQEAQTLGTNAVLTINGTSITSASNTITSDVSGITGLTLTLNDKTTSAATINVAKDTAAAVTAITNFVSSYNMAISNTESATKSDGKLYGESLLTMFESTIRKSATAGVSFDNAYKSLASIGITTGAVTTDMNADIKQLKIDTTKLTAALESNPDGVMNLLIGNDTLKTNGVLTKMGKTLESSLDASKGYFTRQNTSYENQVDRLNDKISRMTTSMEKYQARLEAKFQAMDKLISTLQSSSSVFDSYFNNKSSKSS